MMVSSVQDKMSLVSVVTSNGDCYFHVIGDSKKYYDLKSIYKIHPEHEEYINEHYFDLNGEYKERCYDLSLDERR